MAFVTWSHTWIKPGLHKFYYHQCTRQVSVDGGALPSPSRKQECSKLHTGRTKVTLECLLLWYHSVSSVHAGHFRQTLCHSLLKNSRFLGQSPTSLHFHTTAFISLWSWLKLLYTAKKIMIILPSPKFNGNECSRHFKSLLRVKTSVFQLSKAENAFIPWAMESIWWTHQHPAFHNYFAFFRYILAIL